MELVAHVTECQDGEWLWLGKNACKQPPEIIDAVPILSATAGMLGTVSLSWVMDLGELQVGSSFFLTHKENIRYLGIKQPSSQCILTIHFSACFSLQKWWPGPPPLPPPEVHPPATEAPATFLYIPCMVTASWPWAPRDHCQLLPSSVQQDVPHLPGCNCTAPDRVGAFRLFRCPSLTTEMFTNDVSLQWSEWQGTHKACNSPLAGLRHCGNASIVNIEMITAWWKKCNFPGTMAGVRNGVVKMAWQCHASSSHKRRALLCLHLAVTSTSDELYCAVDTINNRDNRPIFLLPVSTIFRHNSGTPWHLGILLGKCQLAVVTLLLFFPRFVDFLVAVDP